MKLFHHGTEVGELPDEWWKDAGMIGFVRTGSSYAVDACRRPGQKVFQVSLDDVEPVRRKPGIPIFNDDQETGASARQRVVSILRGFRSGDVLPPVKVVALPAGNVHKYKLVEGAHRFYCALAVGFTSVPALEGFDWASLDAEA